VVCPDGIAFRALPDEGVTLPLPPAARAAGLRRWGSDGLAVQSVVGQLPGMGAGVVVHLDADCSVTAVEHGQAAHTTASMSPGGGIPSLTRSGDLDPEVVLRLLDLYEGSRSAVRTLLNEWAGVAGLSCGRTDLRELLAASDSTADLALRVFVRHVAMAVAGAVTTLDGWDTLVFTGDIGVHVPEVRERICARLLPLRPGAAERVGLPSERLAASGVEVRVVPADEEAVLDRMARAVVLTPAAAEDDGTWHRKDGRDLDPPVRT
jgi:acetate kinase